MPAVVGGGTNDAVDILLVGRSSRRSNSIFQEYADFQELRLLEAPHLISKKLKILGARH